MAPQKKKDNKSKSPSKKAQSKLTSDTTAQYIKAINLLLKKLDKESLNFLYEQATVLLHNLEVKKLQQQFDELDVKTISAKKQQFSKYTLEVVEADDLRHFIFVINGARNFFSRDEMRKLVKLCHSAPTPKDGMRMLFSWFENNRKDVIIDTAIDGPNDKALETMYKHIVSNYTVGQ
ncbi:MAG: hypothetical protein ACUVRK_07770 [Spirochaetota bacterium]